MPSGHMAHSLPRENFKVPDSPQVHAQKLAQVHAVIQQLRNPTQAGGLSPASAPGQAPTKIISSPGRLPRFQR